MINQIILIIKLLILFRLYSPFLKIQKHPRKLLWQVWCLIFCHEECIRRQRLPEKAIRFPLSLPQLPLIIVKLSFTHHSVQVPRMNADCLPTLLPETEGSEAKCCPARSLNAAVRKHQVIVFNKTNINFVRVKVPWDET